MLRLTLLGSLTIDGFMRGGGGLSSSLGSTHGWSIPGDGSEASLSSSKTPPPAPLLAAFLCSSATASCSWPFLSMSSLTCFWSCSFSSVIVFKRLTSASSTFSSSSRRSFCNATEAAVAAASGTGTSWSLSSSLASVDKWPMEAPAAWFFSKD